MIRKCPKDWKYTPKMLPATRNMMVTALFNNDTRFRHVRNLWFRRCNASGKMIWPLQKAWVGVVIQSYSYSDMRGKYWIAWLTENQYVVEKLKGNI